MFNNIKTCTIVCESKKFRNSVILNVITTYSINLCIKTSYYQHFCFNYLN